MGEGLHVESSAIGVLLVGFEILLEAGEDMFDDA
jgi:hypothetical protein